MPPLPAIAVGVYLACQAGLVVAGLHRLILLYWLRKPAPPIAPRAQDFEWPFVTLQLPVYNERFVIRRLIQAALAQDYPRDRFEIQVLDDSTDSTLGEIQACVRETNCGGIPVQVIHRSRRTGFKAGALENGLGTARGSLIAIFDADFVPPPDFLRQAALGFGAPDVGMVQARWGHLNRDSSRLTQVQALFLDAHFRIEHRARAAAGRLFNFNGTAGVWRRAAIVEAGGWQHDTLTEDFDLSYRAQLKGWRFVFLEGLEVPGELPRDIHAFKSQQYRWAKGSAQTACKLLLPVLQSRLPWALRLEAVFHLLSNFTYVLALALAVLLLPLLWLPGRGPGPTPWQILAPIFALSTGAFMIFFAAALVRARRAGRVAWGILPWLFLVGIGMSLHNVRAVLAGLFSRGGEFHRTPKTGAGQVIEGSPFGPGYPSRVDGGALGELLLAVYFGVCAWLAAGVERWEAVVFLSMFSAGFAYVGGLTLKVGLRHGLRNEHDHNVLTA